MKPDVRDRLVLPILIPVGLLLTIIVLTVGFGMLLLFNPMGVSLMIAIVVSAAIAGGFALIARSTDMDLTNTKRSVVLLAAIGPIVIGSLVAADVLPTGDEKVVERDCEFCIPPDAVEVVAENISFLQEVVELPDAAVGGDVSILFRNEDGNIPHNIWIYPFQEQQEQPLLDEPIFEGETFNGPAQRVYTFQAPEAGAYYFNCTVHPQQMTGTIIFGQPAA